MRKTSTKNVVFHGYLKLPEANGMCLKQGLAPSCHPYSWWDQGSFRLMNVYNATILYDYMCLYVLYNYADIYKVCMSTMVYIHTYLCVYE